MRTMLTLGLAAIVVPIMALGALDADAARKKKPRTAPVHRVTQDSVSGIVKDEYGTPIIMQGFRPSHTLSAGTANLPNENRETQRAVRHPRGSSTLIPPPVPSPNSPNSPPAPGALQPGPGVYQPPPINSFSDRVRNCIHSAPLNAGIGNNPADRQMYIGQCAN